MIQAQHTESYDTHNNTTWQQEAAWSQKDNTTLHVIKKSCESKRMFQGYDITEFSVITKNNQLLLTRQETKCLHFGFAFAAKRD